MKRSLAAASWLPLLFPLLLCSDRLRWIRKLCCFFCGKLCRFLRGCFFCRCC